MKATFAILTAIALAATGAAPGAKPLPGKSVTISPCFVSVLDKYDIDVPAQDAGVLATLRAYEGLQVYKDDPLAQIDDMEPKMRRQIAALERDAAKKRAENTINVQYAQAAAKVAGADYDRDREANRAVLGTITESQLRRDKLDWDRARLQIKQAAEDRLLAGLTAKSKAAEVDAADKAIERRLVKAPVDGEVVRVYRQAGEWVKPGDPILQIKRFDVLRIKTTMKTTEFDPHEIEQRTVTVEAELARGRIAKFQGTVAYVSPEVQADGAYAVWADVANRKEGGKWLLRPGLTVEMTVHLK